MNRICLYHRDLDGKCAAAIVRRKYPDCRCIAVDYNDPLSYGELRLADELVIVDFSIPPEDMQTLLDAGVQVTWVDHHQSAIEKFRDFPENIPGIRSEEAAGCVLTWRYYFAAEEVPFPVALIGDRDTWTWEYGMTEDFCAGMDTIDTDPDNCELWASLFGDVTGTAFTFHDIYDGGVYVTAYRERHSAKYRDAWAFEREVNGHSMLCMNLARCGSKAFGDAEGEYDLLCSFAYNGDTWTLSFYSEELSARKLAEHYGGGGHPGAAGCVLDEFPFGDDEPISVPADLTREDA